MNRRIAVDLYNALIALRPDWASAKDDDAEAEKDKAWVVKVVMTGSADDGPDWQPHNRPCKIPRLFRLDPRKAESIFIS